MLEYLWKKQLGAQDQEARPAHAPLSEGAGNQAMLSMLGSQGGRRSAKPASGGKPLADAMQAKFERQFGVPMDDVQVYRNSPEPAKLGALAYTKGTDVFLAPGQEQHLEHELGHVVQQKFGLVKPTAMIAGLPVNLDLGLEQRADMLSIQGSQAPQGDSVIQMKLPYMYHQLALNCGFSALARAISKLIPEDGNDLASREDLEERLSSHAVQSNYSVIGEAFDPETIVRTCDDIYGMELSATIVDMDEENTLQSILESAKGKNQVVLLPYFAAPDASTPKVNTAGTSNAHWAALDPNDLTAKGKILLYEGNKQGVVRTDGAVAPKKWATKDLQKSNESITDTFDWERFIDNPRVSSEVKKKNFNMFLEPPQKYYTHNYFLNWRMKTHVKHSLLYKKRMLEKTGRLNAEDFKESVNLKGKAIVISLKSPPYNSLDDEVD